MPVPKPADPYRKRKSVWGCTRGSTRGAAAWDELFPGSELTPEEVLFGKVMHGLKAKLGRMPTAAEVLAAALGMGYVREGGA